MWRSGSTGTHCSSRVRDGSSAREPAAVARLKRI
jgi:hypothetical protein